MAWDLAAKVAEVRAVAAAAMVLVVEAMAVAAAVVAVAAEVKAVGDNTCRPTGNHYGGS